MTALAVCAEPVPGYQVVVNQFTVSAAAGSATTVVSCPLGKRVLGGGGHVFINGGGALNRVVLTGVYPQDAALHSVRVSAAEDQGGYNAEWSLAAYAVCADPVAGLELVTRTSPSSSTDRTINATCPSGKRVLGAGGEIVGGFGEVVFDDLTPQNGPPTSSSPGSKTKMERPKTGPYVLTRSAPRPNTAGRASGRPPSGRSQRPW